MKQPNRIRRMKPNRKVEVRSRIGRSNQNKKVEVVKMQNHRSKKFIVILEMKIERLKMG